MRQVERKLKYVCAGLLAVVTASGAQAAIVYDFQETAGGDVVGVLSGSLDTSGLTASEGGKGGIGLNPSQTSLYSGTDGDADLFGAPFVSITPFGAGGFTLASATTGDTFVIPGNNLYLPKGYLSGSALDGSLTFESTTFALMGVTPGSYVFTLDTLSNDTVTIQFGVSAVPIPAAAWLFGSALLGLGVIKRKKA